MFTAHAQETPIYELTVKNLTSPFASATLFPATWE